LRLFLLLTACSFRSQEQGSEVRGRESIETRNRYSLPATRYPLLNHRPGRFLWQIAVELCEQSVLVVAGE